MLNLFKSNSTLQSAAKRSKTVSQSTDPKTESKQRMSRLQKICKKNMEVLKTLTWGQEIQMDYQPDYETVQIVSLSGTLSITSPWILRESDKCFLAVELASSVVGDCYSSAAMAFAYAFFQLMRHGTESVLRGSIFSPDMAHRHKVVYSNVNLGAAYFLSPLPPHSCGPQVTQRKIGDLLVYFEGGTSAAQGYMSKFRSLWNKTLEFGKRTEILQVQAAMFEDSDQPSRLLECLGEDRRKDIYSPIPGRQQ